MRSGVSCDRMYLSNFGQFTSRLFGDVAPALDLIHSALTSPNVPVPLSSPTVPIGTIPVYPYCSYVLFSKRPRSSLISYRPHRIFPFPTLLTPFLFTHTHIDILSSVLGFLPTALYVLCSVPTRVHVLGFRFRLKLLSCDHCVVGRKWINPVWDGSFLRLT